jgi:hypothetical protein
VWYTIYRHHHQWPPPPQGSKVLRRRNQHVPVHYKVLRHCHFTGHLQETLSLPLLFSPPPFAKRRGRRPPSRCISRRIAHHRPACQLSISKATHPSGEVSVAAAARRSDAGFPPARTHVDSRPARRHGECAQVLDTLLQPAPRRRRPLRWRCISAVRSAGSFLPRSRAFD